MLSELPEEFLKRFQTLCPEQYLNSALISFQQQKPISFRLNYLIEQDVQATLNTLQKENNIQVHHYRFQPFPEVTLFHCDASQRDQLTHSDMAEQGLIYIQNPSSMLAPLILSPKQSDWVLDLAAAPGGKTLLLAELMNNGGKISAVEPVKNRFFRLKGNLEKNKAANVTCYMKDGRQVGRLKPNSFDKILLDAPCSSESRFFTKDKKSFSHWSLKKIKECSRKQKGLMISAFDALKPGGTLLYCTCSFAPEENEAVVSYLLKKRAAASISQLALTLDNASRGIQQWNQKIFHPNCHQTLRVWPTNIMDGFYLALITKSDNR